MRYFLVLSSAVLYAIACMLPVYCWWTICIFLVPLFYLILVDTLIMRDGVLWSTVAFSLHLSGVLQGLFITATGSLFFATIPAALVLLTAIVYGICWFASLIWSLGWPLSRVLSFCNAVVITWLFFLFLERACLCMFGIIEGYLLCSPLIPLVQYPGLLYFLPKIGPVLLLLFFIITQACCAITLVAPRCWWLAAVCMIFWLSGILLSPKQDTMQFVDKTLVCAPKYFKAHDNVMHSGRVIRDYCKALLQKKPDTEIILFPETAIKCHFWPGEKNSVKLLNACELGKPITIITGGFRWDHDHYRNTVYWISDGNVIDLFDKRHAMALTERCPQEYFLGKYSFIKDIYFKKALGINKSNYARPCWHIAKNLKIIPYICSELFFNHNPDHKKSADCIIIALCNDAWLPSGYMRKLMVMGARYRALQWRIPLVYVAYHYQAYCGVRGQYKTLTTFCQAWKHPEDVSID